MEIETTINTKFLKLKPFLNEKQIRLYAAAEALAIGYGGISIVSRSINLSRKAIAKGCKDLLTPESNIDARVRAKGAGRKKAIETNKGLKQALDNLISPVTRGDPESHLRWTSKSTRKLAEALGKQGHTVCHQTVASLLIEMGYSLQANKKVIEGGSHPDRDAQFEHINQKVADYQACEQPVISVDTKKKELVGNYKNVGKELRPKGSPERVNTYDFPDKELGKASPYGIYDMANNLGWVNVGIDHDTAQFAVESIRLWWHSMGKQLYKNANRLLITADGGGSNGSRVKLWKLELQKLADEIGIEISVCHFPPGTSKWNKIEHRLFSFISQNWRGKPLTSHQVIVSLIASTATKAGLKVDCQLDKNSYPTGIKVSKSEMDSINLTRDKFHGEWNYTIAVQQAS